MSIVLRAAPIPPPISFLVMVSIYILSDKKINKHKD